MSWQGADRRKFHRYGVKGSLVQFRRGGALGFLNPLSKRHIILNLSEGGLLFISREPFEEGERLSVSLHAPGMEEPVVAKMRVAWQRRSAEFDAYRIGLEFVRLSAVSRRALQSLLQNAVLDKIEITTRVYLKELEKL